MKNQKTLILVFCCATVGIALWWGSSFPVYVSKTTAPLLLSVETHRRPEGMNASQAQQQATQVVGHYRYDFSTTTFPSEIFDRR